MDSINLSVFTGRSRGGGTTRFLSGKVTTVTIISVEGFSERGFFLLQTKIIHPRLCR